MKTEFKLGSFTDFTGAERKYVMAAVSLDDVEEFSVDEYDSDTDEIDTRDIPKILSVAVSVCRPADEFNEKIGKRIAEGKAVKRRDHTMYVTDPGMVNDTVVKAVLEQESKFFEEHPGRYITGYHSDEQKYKLNQAKKQYMEELSEEGKTAYKFLRDATETDIKLMSLALQVHV